MQCSKIVVLALTVLVGPAAWAVGPASEGTTESSPPGPFLFQEVQVPREFLITVVGVSFGGDLRIGDLTGDGQCDFLACRCDHGAARGAHVGGMKPVFLGAFDLDGRPLWKQGKGGSQTSRPMKAT